MGLRFELVLHEGIDHILEFPQAELCFRGPRTLLSLSSADSLIGAGESVTSIKALHARKLAVTFCPRIRVSSQQYELVRTCYERKTDFLDLQAAQDTCFLFRLVTRGCAVLFLLLLDIRKTV
jgi:hypothetical protein